VRESHTQKGGRILERGYYEKKKKEKRSKTKRKIKKKLSSAHTYPHNTKKTLTLFYFSKTYKYLLKIKVDERKNIEEHTVKRTWYKGSRA